LTCYPLNKIELDKKHQNTPNNYKLIISLLPEPFIHMYVMRWYYCADNDLNKKRVKIIPKVFHEESNR
jgi:hypothetical protein